MIWWEVGVIGAAIVVGGSVDVGREKGVNMTAPIYERPCVVTLADDGAVTVTRPDGLTVVVKPVEPPIRLDPEETDG